MSKNKTHKQKKYGGFIPPNKIPKLSRSKPKLKSKSKSRSNKSSSQKI